MKKKLGKEVKREGGSPNRERGATISKKMMDVGVDLSIGKREAHKKGLKKNGSKDRGKSKSGNHFHGSHF